MANFVHLTPLRNAPRILRSGIAARSRGWSGDRGVYVVPVLSSFTLTYQWARELRRWKPGTLVAVHIRVPDSEPVTVGPYGRPPTAMSAAEATALLRDTGDPRGHQVFLPRAVRSREVRSVRQIPQGTGWRYTPDAHGGRPCPCPACLDRGSYGATRGRRLP